MPWSPLHIYCVSTNVTVSTVLIHWHLCLRREQTQKLHHSPRSRKGRVPVENEKIHPLSRNSLWVWLMSVFLSQCPFCFSGHTCYFLLEVVKGSPESPGKLCCLTVEGTENKQCILLLNVLVHSLCNCILYCDTAHSPQWEIHYFTYICNKKIIHHIGHARPPIQRHTITRPSATNKAF